MSGVTTVQTLQVKHRYQLVIRLKANKCYQKLLCYLSSYINFLNIRLCSGPWSLRNCYWQCNYYYLRGCPDCISSHIALIALTVSLIVLLWLYCWLHCFDCFDCSDRIAGRIALIFVLEIVLCFRYHFHYLILEVRALRDVIYLPNESYTYI